VVKKKIQKGGKYEKDKRVYEEFGEETKDSREAGSRDRSSKGKETMRGQVYFNLYLSGKCL
jgi:hypothetical protein